MLPDNVKEAEARLGQSMETYRQRCDNLGNSLHGLLNKMEDERFFGDLATEVNKLRKLVSDEKKKVGGERLKLGEVHAMFEQVRHSRFCTLYTCTRHIPADLRRVQPSCGQCGRRPEGDTAQGRTYLYSVKIVFHLIL